MPTARGSWRRAKSWQGGSGRGGGGGEGGGAGTAVIKSNNPHLWGTKVHLRSSAPLQSRAIRRLVSIQFWTNSLRCLNGSNHSLLLAEQGSFWEISPHA